MSDSAAGSTRRRSSKPGDSAARRSAIDRLKAIRGAGGRRSAAGVDFQVKLEQPIYDTVEEEDYARLVARRRELAQGFIVDDDGLGYGDEGEEEDWAQSGLPPSSDEEEDEGTKKTRKKKAEKQQQTKGKDQPAQQPKRPAPTSLSAAAAMMGKDRLSALFTSSVWKNDRSKGMSSASDSIVDDLIAEITVDESDREARRRKRGLPPAQPPYVAAPQALSPSNGSFKTELPQPPIHEDLTTPMELSAPEFQGDVGGADMDLVENGHSVPIENGAAEVKEEKASEQNVEAHSNGQLDAPITEVKQELAAPKAEKEVSLNAKIGALKNDKIVSAIDGWKAILEGDKQAHVSDVSAAAVVDEKTEFGLDTDGSLPFYIIDAHEELFGANAGTVYLFGKVKVGKAYHSCCVVVRNMQRCVYAIPNSSVFQNNKMTELEADLANSKITAPEFRAKLQGMSSELKADVAEKLLDLNVSSFSMMPVKRSYAFERSDIPLGEQYVLKINYPFKDQALSADLKGNLFHALLGVNSSALELFLIKRKIKGPSWLSVSRFAIPSMHQRVSWCKFEVIVESPKDICVSTSKAVLEIPPLLAASINLKTIINEKTNSNEIVSASIICCHKAKIDGPMIASEWERPGVLSHFTVIRKLEGSIFPVGFAKDVSDRNLKADLTVLALESSERALLNRLMIELHKLDVDVLAGHNISGFDLDVLLHRSQACKVPSSMWSKIGRLKRSFMPKLTKGSTLYGSGASPGLMSCIAGRLLCDTYVCSRDLLKEVSYSLTHLAKSQLNKDRKEVNPHDIPSMFQASRSLLELVEYGETDAWLSMALMFHLSILPLTRQLTNISGNLWGKTMQGARAQRVEYLLLHAFHAKKYIVPDKNTGKTKESITKRKLNTGLEGGGEELVNDVTLDNDIQHQEQGNTRKGPAYAGGLVLEPKKGLYDKIVLLLDFNSLYPSIIQEYNICFTTVERTGASSTLPSSRTMGVLPELLKNLVERRRMVKSWLKTASGLKVQQLDIQQQALKLTANSMYGCLGFSNSRFYAKPIAELITSQGREILQSTVDLVQNVLNLEVIYGDTDSIMIYSGMDDISKAKAMAGRVIQEVNKKYRCLEIDLDGLYKRMLLLKKKKYAAVKIQIKDGIPFEIIERKGLDMVRRDWSLLSKEIGDFCLSQILSGGSCEDVVETIHSTLTKKQEEMRNGEIELEKYVIMKTLTKPPEEYPDGRNQPHVQVALRLKQSGYSSGFSPGDTIPYIICCEPGTHSSTGGLADRARHPDELKRDSGKWMIDIDYYLSQQILPVVSRLCASIQGTSPARLADCLGLDSSKFQHKVVEPGSRDPSSVLMSVLDDDNRYDGCEPLRLTCPSCSSSFECPPVSSMVQSLLNTSDSDGGKPPESNFWQKIRCSKCPEDMEGSRISSAMVANQVKRQAEHFISVYYKGLMTCDDEICKYTTRIINPRVIGDSERGTVCPNYPRCNGHLVRQLTEAELYKQLSYFHHVFDTKQCLDKLDKDVRLQFEKELARIHPIINLASATIQKIRDRCAYGWVQLKDLVISV